MPELLAIRQQVTSLAALEFDVRRDGRSADELVGREKLVSRAIISAAFSLVEAFISGLFFTAVNTKALGSMACDEDFIEFARKKEDKTPLRGRLDRVVRFASQGAQCGESEPFKSLIETGKRYRDAIHHTTPFGRRDIAPGGRLTALYEINGYIALQCVVLACTTILEISQLINLGADTTDLAVRCQALLGEARPQEHSSPN